MIRRDSGNCASAPPRGQSGGTEGWSSAAAQTGKSGACSFFLSLSDFFLLPVVLNACLLPAWAGGCVFPLPSKPLPERHPQQPPKDLLPGWSQSVVHAAPAAGPGEGDDHQKLKFQQINNNTQTCVCFVSRSLTPPPPSGSLCLGCSWSLTRRMRKDGRPPQTRLVAAPAEAYRSLRRRLCRTPAGS